MNEGNGKRPAWISQTCRHEGIGPRCPSYVSGFWIFSKGRWTPSRCDNAGSGTSSWHVLNVNPQGQSYTWKLIAACGTRCKGLTSSLPTTPKKSSRIGHEGEAIAFGTRIRSQLPTCRFLSSESARFGTCNGFRHLSTFCLVRILGLA